jgi:DNA-binding LacI/PurR family transcriptional regulator
MASGLRLRKTNMIGCIIPNFTEIFYGELTNTIVAVANNRGYDCVLCNSFDNINRYRSYLDLYNSGMLDGMIIVPADEQTTIDTYKAMSKDNFPVVFVYRYIPSLGSNCTCVCSDGYSDAYMVTTKFIKMNHRKIIFLGNTGYSAVSLTLDRMRGYEKAIQQNGLEPIIYYSAPDKPLEEQPLYKNLTSKDRATVIILSSTKDSRYVLNIITQCGLKIPTDVSLASFGAFSLEMSNNQDVKTMKCIEKAPLILDLKEKKMGELAVDILLKKIDSNEKFDQQIYFCADDI